MDSKVIWVGVDWGHDHCEVYCESPALQRRAPTKESRALGEELGSLGDDVRVVIETKSGPVVHALREAGVRVFEVNPAKVEAARRLHSMSDAKDDRRDARVLAGLGRLPETLNEVQPADESVVRLRAASRRREDVSGRRVAATGQLRAVLQASHPGALELGGLECSWVLSLLLLAPSPRAAMKVHKSQVQAVLRRSRVRRVSAEQVLALLRTEAPAMGAGEAEAFELDVMLLAKQAELFLEQRRVLDRELKLLLDEYGTREPAVALLRSYPGIGAYTAACLLGEGLVEQLRQEPEAARALAGVAPVTSMTGRRQTARRGKATMRRACNPHLRRAMHIWAEKSVQNCERSRARYQALRARGHTHGRALRQLGDSHLRRLRAMLRDGTLYRSHERTEQPMGPELPPEAPLVHRSRNSSAGQEGRVKERSPRSGAGFVGRDNVVPCATGVLDAVLRPGEPQPAMAEGVRP